MDPSHTGTAQPTVIEGGYRKIEEIEGVTPSISYTYFTAPLNLFPGLNLATFEAGMLISLPVLGFRPFRDFLLATEKVPKPVKVILSPFLKAEVTADVQAFNAFSAAVFVTFASFAIAAIKSAFVINIYLHEFDFTPPGAAWHERSSGIRED